MFKVSLLVLSGVSLLPLAVQAMEEGENWVGKGGRRVPLNRALPQVPVKQEQTPVTNGEKEEGKEKGENKNNDQRPQLTRTDAGLHFSQVTGIVRKKPAALKEENKEKEKKPSDLQSRLEQAQEKNESFMAQVENIIFWSSDVESILYPPCKMTSGIPIGDLFVSPKQGDEAIRILKKATNPLYVKKFLNKVRKGETLDPDKMEHYYIKALQKKAAEKKSTGKEIPDSVHPKVFAYFDGIVIGNYEGTTVQTKNKEQGSHDYQGKVLAFKLGLKDENLGDIDLSYPNKDDMSRPIMLPAKMTLSITYSEENK